MDATPQNPTPKKRWPTWAKGFLKALAIKGNVTRAAAVVKKDPSTAYDLRREDTEFAAAWDLALETAADILEEESHRRAYDGVSRPVLYQGKPIFVSVDKKGNIVPPQTKGATKRALLEHEYSDTLMIFLLNGLRPGKYRKQIGLSGPTGGPVQLGIIEEIVDATPANDDPPAPGPS